MIQFELVTAQSQMMQVENLAREIFHEHYDEYMDSGHVEFYLQKYQTAVVIAEQIDENFEYYLIKSETETAGYIGIEFKPDLLRVSKLYILDSYRNRKLGSLALDFAENVARKKKLREMDLYVNERNEKGIRFYTSKGYSHTGKMVHTYENGHSEVDLLMKKMF